MELFSHNTMTYRSPKQWYLKPLFWMARCQSNDYVTQYKNGARYFDLRIRFTKKGEIEFGHTFFRYNGEDIYSIIDWMATYAQGIRVTLESVGSNIDYDRFIHLCRFMEDKGITLYGGYSREDHWGVVYKCNEMPAVLHLYSSQTAWYKKIPMIDDWFPWLYSFFHNEKMIRQYENTEKVLFMDFI